METWFDCIQAMLWGERARPLEVVNPKGAESRALFLQRGGLRWSRIHATPALYLGESGRKMSAFCADAQSCSRRCHVATNSGYVPARSRASCGSASTSKSFAREEFSSAINFHFPSRTP